MCLAWMVHAPAGEPARSARAHLFRMRPSVCSGLRIRPSLCGMLEAAGAGLRHANRPILALAHARAPAQPAAPDSSDLCRGLCWCIGVRHSLRGTAARRTRRTRCGNALRPNKSPRDSAAICSKQRKTMVMLYSALHNNGGAAGTSRTTVCNGREASRERETHRTHGVQQQSTRSRSLQSAVFFCSLAIHADRCNVVPQAAAQRPLAPLHRHSRTPRRGGATGGPSSSRRVQNAAAAERMRALAFARQCAVRMLHCAPLIAQRCPCEAPCRAKTCAVPAH